MSETGTSQPGDGSDAFRKFSDLTRRLLAVPKSEVPKHVPKKRVKPATKKTRGK
jgi:hypothetical protein